MFLCTKQPSISGCQQGEKSGRSRTASFGPATQGPAVLHSSNRLMCSLLSPSLSLSHLPYPLFRVDRLRATASRRHMSPKSNLTSEPRNSVRRRKWRTNLMLSKFAAFPLTPTWLASRSHSAFFIGSQDFLSFQLCQCLCLLRTQFVNVVTNSFHFRAPQIFLPLLRDERAPSGSVRTPLLQGHKSQGVHATVTVWKLFPSAPIRLTCCSSASAGFSNSFLKRAFVYPRKAHQFFSLCITDATLRSIGSAFRSIKFSSRYVQGGNIMLSNCHLFTVSSSQESRPAGTAGGHRRGMVCVNVGSLSCGSSSPHFHLQQASTTFSKGPTSSSNSTSVNKLRLRDRDVCAHAVEGPRCSRRGGVFWHETPHRRRPYLAERLTHHSSLRCPHHRQ